MTNRTQFHVVCYSDGKIWIDGVRKIAPPTTLVRWARETLGEDSARFVEFHENGTYSEVVTALNQEKQ